MKATEQHFSVVLFTRLYKVFQTFEYVDETAKQDFILLQNEIQHSIFFLFLCTLGSQGFFPTALSISPTLSLS